MPSMVTRRLVPVFAMTTVPAMPKEKAGFLPDRHASRRELIS